MIKFFRKIRYDLMEKNKTGKYLKYAIGEIVLVVIGILIALQINNWNQSIFENEKRIALLNALKTEFKLTEKSVKENIHINELRSVDLLKLMELSAGSKENISQDSIKVMLQNSLMFYFFDTFSITYEQAKSSGKLSLIKSDNLLQALKENEENIKGLKSVEIPVFGESYEEFNAQVEIMKRMNTMTIGSIKSPKSHPKVFLTDSTMDDFIQSEETYKKLYHLYFMNTLKGLWWKSLELSIVKSLEEIEISLNK